MKADYEYMIKQPDLEEQLKELQKKYDELNDFSNSQCAKLLEENARLLKVIEQERVFSTSENEKLKSELEKEKKLNSHIKARFVECNTCTQDKKEKCLMFSENLCEGERCEEIIDLYALINKNMIDEENEQLKKENEELKAVISKKETTTEKNSEVEQLKKQYKKQRNRRIDELQKENAELKNGTILKELTEKVKQQAEQIEKMKCCGNCKKRNSCIKHNTFVYPEMTNPINYNCYDLDEWECGNDRV